MYPKFLPLTLEILSTVKVLVFWALLTSCTKKEITVVIECVPNDTLKYEYEFKRQKSLPDSIDGNIRKTLFPYPTYYGFSEAYVSDDGDYLDAFVIAGNTFVRDEQVKVEINTLILMRDNGVEDSKLICSTKDMIITAAQIEQIRCFLLGYSADTIIIDSIIDVNYIHNVKQLINEYK